MSESMSMLDDNLYINNINPFWEEPPGARSKPYLFNPSVKNTIEQEPDETDSGTPEGGVEQRCPLRRPLYPKRYIDGEEVVIVPTTAPAATTAPVFQVALGQTDIILIGVILVIIFLLSNMD